MMKVLLNDTCVSMSILLSMKNFLLPTEFMEWKDEYEKNSKSWFIKATGAKVRGEATLTYYYCNRSGYFHSQSAGKRRLKSQGSSKINTHCTAALVLSHNEYDKSILVEVCHSHYGHSQTLGHLRLPDTTRQRIAGQLAQGVSFERILDDIRDTVGDRFNRIHLVTRKDIANIERAYGLKGVEKHPVDAVSVGAWIEEWKSKGEDSPVLLIKSQGQAQPENCDNLEDQDFVLILQTPLQREMIKNCEPNRVVCVDATHGTNGYDFSLISVLVVDEFGEGFPVGWCLSNKQDQFLLMNFFERLKEKVGDIVPAWFMSDDAEQFYTAWIAVFGPGPRKLLCTWHVDKAWRTNLKSLIGNRDTEAAVYHNLRVLLEETDTGKFENLLHKTVQQLNLSEVTQTFGKYFSQYYAKTKEQWAACYRKAAFVNTNMYVEAFHHVLKYIYMKGKVNKRVDKCIHVLKFARDKAFERLVKLEKGKVTARIHVIMARHLASQKLPTHLVTEQSDTSWIVTSHDGQRDYYVTWESDGCQLQCLKCTECACNWVSYVFVRL